MQSKIGCIKYIDIWRDFMLKRVLALVVVLAMVFSIVGCAKQEPAPAPAPETPATETPATETPATGGDDLLVWNIAVDPQTWDPTLNSAADGGHIIQNLFEGLTRETKEGIEAAAAESWEITNDGKTYTFKLREGMKWSDGQPLTAKDFEYAWKRACDPATASEYSFLVTSYIVGGEEFFNGTGSRDDVGVKALDDTTLEVNLKFPVAYFLSLTSFYTYMPVREDMVAKGEGWEKNPETCVSNGPFKMTEYKTGDHLTMVKNDNYWDAQRVKLAGVKGLMINEGTTALNGYENGEIQVLDGITIEQIPRLQKEDPNFKIYPQVGTYYVNFNVDNEVFKDVNVRKAFSLAIDRKSFVEQVTKGGQIPATGFIPSGMIYSDGTDIRPLDSATGAPAPEFGIDPTKALVDEAKALLAEAGYADGKGLPEITFLYNTNENNKKIAEALQGMWKQNLGVDVKLLNQDWAVFQETRRAGEYMMARGGWLGDYGDPMTMLDLFAVKSGNNDPQWRYNLQPVVAPHDTTLNPEQEAFEKAINDSMLSSGKDRDKALKAAEDALMNNHVVAPIYYYTMSTIVDSSVVEGVELTLTNKWDFSNAELVK